MKRTSLLYTLMTCLCLLTSSCKQSHELTSVLTEAESLMYTHPDSALHLLQAIPNPEGLTGQAQADYALLLTQAKSRNRIYATSDSLIRIAIDYYQNSDEMEQKAKSLLYLADVYMDMERYADATLPLKQAEELMEHVPDRQMQTMIYSNLGFLNRKAGDYEQAFSYYKKALAINRANQDSERIVSNLVNIMNLPIPEFADSAENYIHQLEQEVTSARPKLQSKTYNNIGVYYLKQDLFKEAETFFKKAISVSKDIHYRSYLNLADIYNIQEKYKQADSLYQVALQSPIWETRALIYKNIYQRKLKLGQEQEAAQYMNQYIQAVDSFHTHRESDQILELQQKYDQAVILRQKDQIEIWLYRIVFSFTLLIGILAIFTWNQKKKNKAKLQALQEQINKITSSSKNAEEKISKLNDMLAQSDIIKQEYNQMLQVTSKQDIDALAVYLRLLQSLESYNDKNDAASLKRWLDLSQNNFATRLKAQYPNLSPVELTLSCLLRMGYSINQISLIMNVQKDTIRRNIYRACTHLNIEDEKDKLKKFTSAIISF